MTGVRVALVFPPFVDENYYVTPPLGLLSIAACLERAGHDVRVHDQILMLQRGDFGRGAPAGTWANPRIYDACAEDIAAARPDVVGFSTQCATYPPSLNIARRVRALLPDAFIVFGGHNASFLDRETLERFPYVDAAARGEGEVTAVELAGAIAGGSALREVAGLTWRDRGGSAIRNPDRPFIADLDDLPFPAYHLVPPLYEYRALGNRCTALVDSGRGCSFNCIFCSNCRLWRHKVRYRSIPSIVREIARLVEMGAEEVYLVHDFFTADRDKVLEFCHLLVDAGMKVEWQCRCRISGMDRGLLETMHAAGCTRLLYGVESGSPATLRFIRKQVDFTRVFRTIRDTVAADIRPSLAFVMGFPSETRRDIDQTLRQILRCQMLGRGFAFINLVTPLPGTELARDYADRFVLAVPTAFSTGLEFHRGLRLEEDELLIRAHPGIFSSFYNITNDEVPMALLGELTSLFCPLTQAFSYSFTLLADALGWGPLTLFERWLAWARSEGLLPPAPGLPGRAESWQAFAAFARGLVADLQDPPPILDDIFRYECAVADLHGQDPGSVALPSPTASVAPHAAPARVRLSPRVRLLEPALDLKAALESLLTRELGTAGAGGDGDGGSRGGGEAGAAAVTAPGRPVVVALVACAVDTWDLATVSLSQFGGAVLKAAGGGATVEEIAGRVGQEVRTVDQAVRRLLETRFLEPA